MKFIDGIYSTYLPYVPYQDNSLEKYHECMRHFAKELGHLNLVDAPLPNDILSCRKALMTLVPVLKYLHQSDEHNVAVAAALLFHENTLDLETAEARLREYRRKALQDLFTIEKKPYLRYVPYFYCTDNLNIDTTRVDQELETYAKQSGLSLQVIKSMTEVSTTPDDKDNLYKYSFQSIDDHL